MRINREEYYFKCPKCSTPNVYKGSSLKTLNHKYKCGDCGQEMYLDIKNKKLILGNKDLQWIQI